MSPAVNEWVLNVSELNGYVGRMLKADSVLRSLRLRGEVSGFKAYPSGHWYFTLKDERCRISCVMFRSDAMRMSFRPREGDAVVLHGAVRMYEEGGTYQFVADSMRPEGVGLLYRRFEQLKAKLQAEGLFDSGRKRMLPARPRKLAVVTSEAGAVLHDICKVSRERDPGVPIVLVPVPVQGAEAAPKIAQGIRLAGTLPGIDVIVVGRGGGSMEDLWCFNEELVARAIAASPVPVISAVGHETDFTIADFVADVRASTPSNAAELAVPERAELTAALELMARRMDKAAQDAAARARYRVMALRGRLEARRPDVAVKQTAHRMTELRARLEAAVERKTADLPARIDMASIRLENALELGQQRRTSRLRELRGRLEAVSPQRVLDRGYALVTDLDGQVVTGAAAAPERMLLRLRDGTLRVRREEEEAHGHEEEADL